MNLFTDVLVGLIVAMLSFVFGVFLGWLADVVPVSTRKAWKRWRDRKLQGQGSYVVRRHRARLEYTS